MKLILKDEVSRHFPFKVKVQSLREVEIADTFTLFFVSNYGTQK